MTHVREKLLQKQLVNAAVVAHRELAVTPLHRLLANVFAVRPVAAVAMAAHALTDAVLLHHVSGAQEGGEQAREGRTRETGGKGREPRHMPERECAYV